MKSTGITRKLDDLGRVVLPKELRDSLDIKERDGIEIYTENDMIILKKFEYTCTFCKTSDSLIRHKDKYICRDCADEIISLCQQDY